jgi:hypothetical protein
VTVMSLLDQISGATMVVVDEERRLAYVWHGGHGVNVIDESGEEIDYFTIGGASRPTPAKVRAAIDQMISLD